MSYEQLSQERNVQPIKKHDYLQILFISFVAIYSTILVLNTHLGPTDDFSFLRTLQRGKLMLYYSPDFPYYDSIKVGRFTPPGAMEYNLFGLFSKSPSPFWYYFYHAVQFIIFAFLITKLIKLVTNNKWLIYGAPTLLFLMPGFTIPFFRLQMNERNIIFFLAIFLLCYLNYLKKQRWVYFLGSFLAANLAIYYKETAFIALGVFAFCHLVLSWKSASKKTKMLDTAILLSAVAYIGLYYFLVLLKNPKAYLGTIYSPYLVFFKNLLNYSL